MPHLLAIGAGSLVLAALSATAQAPQQALVRHCSSAEHRQFDFWLGEWEVTQNGKSAGRNEIRSILGGCALREEWSGAGGFGGVSLNFYNAQTGRWQQTWIDSQGQSLALEGTFDGAGMVLQSSGAPDAPRHRITWTPMADRSVRQLWTMQPTHGAEWKTLFDGHYQMRTAQKPK